MALTPSGPQWLQWCFQEHFVRCVFVQLDDHLFQLQYDRRHLHCSSLNPLSSGRLLPERIGRENSKSVTLLYPLMSRSATVVCREVQVLDSLYISLHIYECCINGLAATIDFKRSSIIRNTLRNENRMINTFTDYRLSWITYFLTRYMLILTCQYTFVNKWHGQKLE